MCVLLHLLICTALRAHIIVVEALYKINYYYYVCGCLGEVGKRDVFCCDNLHYGFFFKSSIPINIVINLKASDAALMCFLN